MENKKKIIIVASVLLVAVIIGFFLVTRKNKEKPATNNPIPTEITIPTVDSSVKVDLSSKIVGKEVTLSIKGIPTGTSSVEYSLSYDTEKQGIQGVIGTVTIKSNEMAYEKDLTLGTCSSGKCVYHDVVGQIKVSLKFTGSYGEKIFEKDFNL